MIVQNLKQKELAFAVSPIINMYSQQVIGTNGFSILTNDFETNAEPRFFYINKKIMYYDENADRWKFKVPVIARLNGIIRFKCGSTSNIVYLYAGNSRIIAPYTNVGINNTGFLPFAFSVETVFQQDEFPAFTLNAVDDDLIIDNNPKLFDYHCYVQTLDFTEKEFYISKR